jgi:hypothetical protein
LRELGATTDVTIFRQIVRNITMFAHREAIKAVRIQKRSLMYFMALVAFVIASVLFGLWTGW